MRICRRVRQSPPPAPGSDPMKPARVVQGFVDAQMVEVRRFLRKISEDAADGAETGRCRYRMSRNGGGTGVRLVKCRENAQQSGFAAAIRPGDRGDSRAEGKRHLVECREFSESHRDAAESSRRVGTAALRVRCR